MAQWRINAHIKAMKSQLSAAHIGHGSARLDRLIASWSHRVVKAAFDTLQATVAKNLSLQTAQQNTVKSVARITRRMQNSLLASGFDAWTVSVRERKTVGART